MKNQVPLLFYTGGASLHSLHCGLLTNLKAAPHPHTKPISMVQTSAHVCSSAPHGDTYRISGLWLLHTACSSCGADHSGPGWARSEAQLVPIYQRALSATAPAYPHLRNSTRAHCRPGRQASYPHQHWRGQNEWFPQRNPPWSGTPRGQASLREPRSAPGPSSGVWPRASGLWAQHCHL